VPYLHDLFIPEEDAVALENPFAIPAPSNEATEIVVIHLPRIANFDDFDPLDAEPGVQIRYVDNPEQIGNPAAIIIPGTKSTINDLEWLRSQGFDETIQKYAQDGGNVVGICGGYQMLGEMIYDPQNVESKQDNARGLGLLPLNTIFAKEKTTHQANAEIENGSGWFSNLEGQTINGYEIHMGRTDSQSSWLKITERSGQSVQVLDGATSKDGKVWGCYVHGLFANENLRRAWLKDLGWNEKAGEKDPFAASLTRLADTLEETLDLEYLEKIIWEN